MAVMLNEGKSCADKAGREINCTLKIDVSDTINTCGYRALELARHYCATAEAYRPRRPLVVCLGGYMVCHQCRNLVCYVGA